MPQGQRFPFLLAPAWNCCNSTAGAENPSQGKPGETAEDNVDHFSQGLLDLSCCWVGQEQPSPVCPQPCEGCPGCAAAELGALGLAELIPTPLQRCQSCPQARRSCQGDLCLCFTLSFPSARMRRRRSLGNTDPQITRQDTASETLTPQKPGRTQPQEH